jgi:hypothetical protein
MTTVLTFPRLDDIPAEVVLRHTCHCDAAVEKPAPHQHDEHVFQVDGDDFPWPLSERGPIVTRLKDDLFAVDVEIYLLGKKDGKYEYLEFGYFPTNMTPFLPLINGRIFPWLLDANGWELKAGHKRLPQINLTFFTRNITGNYPVDDQRERWHGEAIWCAGGDRITDGKDRCWWCKELVEDLPLEDDGNGSFTTGMDRHFDERHPDKIEIRTDSEGRQVRVRDIYGDD